MVSKSLSLDMIPIFVFLQKLMSAVKEYPVVTCSVLILLEAITAVVSSVFN